MEPTLLEQVPVVVSAPTKKIIRSCDILGVSFHSLSLSQSMEVLEDFIKDRKPRQICFSNAHMVSISRFDSEVKYLLNKSDLTLADGMSIVWGARWLGINLPGRVAGPDVMEALCRRAEQKGYKIYLLGSTFENLRRLKGVLKEKFPFLQIVGFYSPPMSEEFNEEETNKILDLIRSSEADILFVGISCPKQEKWISKNLPRLSVPISLGVGAAFDFISGRIPRAPLWMQAHGLEWLYRLWCDPRRLWKRYLLGNAIFLTALLKQMLVQKIYRSLSS